MPTLASTINQPEKLPFFLSKKEKLPIFSGSLGNFHHLMAEFSGVNNDIHLM
jgi:hypothetical protein